MKQIRPAIRKFGVGSLLCILCHFIFINGYSQESQAFEGTTVVEQVYSSGLEGNLLGDPSIQPVNVYLPPGYELFPKNRYPVVYFLHGYGGDYTSHINHLSLDYLISNKIIAPMIVVTPNGKNAYDGCQYVNSYVTGNWEDYIVQDVVQHIESNYNVLNNRDSRGLSGYSMGGSATILIAMKHPSVYGSIVLIGAGIMNMEVMVNQGEPPRKKYIIDAAKIGEYRPQDIWQIRSIFALAAAYSPDSTAPPLFCSLPYNAEGVRIDSIWQKWLKYDPLTLLPVYKDSLQKLNSIQIYIGSADPGLQANESYHQALLDRGIDHGFEIFQGTHSIARINEMLMNLSNHLTGVVPNIQLSTKYFQLKTNILAAESDKVGQLYIVPKAEGLTLNSILDSKVHAADVLADEKYEYPLSDLDYGRYMVYAICNDSIVSNIPEEFCVVPDTSLPVLNLESQTLVQGDSIAVSCSRDGTVCLLECGLWCESLGSASEIMENTALLSSRAILADETVHFSTDSLSAGSYMIYGFDQYGIVSEQYLLEIQATGIANIRSTIINIYPNPVKDLLNIETEHPRNYMLLMNSLSGQLLDSDRWEGSTHKLDLSSLQKGVYFITIRSKDFVTTRKIIKL